MADDFDEAAVVAKWAEITKDNGPEDVAEPVETEKPERSRDESGKLSVKAENEQPVTEPAVATESIEQPLTETPKHEMPATWKQEMAQHWPTLPESVQLEILRREGDQRKGIGQYKQDADFGRRFAEAARPYEATLKQFGVSADVAAAALFKADHALRYGSPQQKVAMVREMLNDYGIDPSWVGAGQVEQSQQPAYDPRVAQLENEIRELKTRDQQSAQVAQEREQQQIISTLIDFAYERDPTTGNPKIRGYDEYGNAIFSPKAGAESFETLRPYMAALIEADPTMDINEAYKRAEYAHPDTRQAVLAKQQAQQRAEAERKAKEAKDANVVNLRSSSSFEPRQANGSIDQTIREEYDRIYGGS